MGTKKHMLRLYANEAIRADRQKRWDAQHGFVHSASYDAGSAAAWLRAFYYTWSPCGDPVYVPSWAQDALRAAINEITDEEREAEVELILASDAMVKRFTDALRRGKREWEAELKRERQERLAALEPVVTGDTAYNPWPAVTVDAEPAGDSALWD